MKRNWLILLCFCFLIAEESCDFARQSKDQEVAEKIRKYIKAEDVKLSYGTLKGLSDSETHFVGLDIKSTRYTDSELDKKLLSSFCAIQLFEKLDPYTIKINNGFNIVFNNDINIPLSNKYFYDKAEIMRAEKAIKNISIFLKACHSGDSIAAMACIDTTYHRWPSGQLKEIYKETRQKIFNWGPGTYMWYVKGSMNLPDSSKNIACFDFCPLILLNDGRYTRFEFYCPQVEANNKIVFINLKKELDKQQENQKPLLQNN